MAAEAAPDPSRMLLSVSDEVWRRTARLPSKDETISCRSFVVFLTLLLSLTLGLTVLLRRGVLLRRSVLLIVLLHYRLTRLVLVIPAV
jgi:hypothetical protein